MPLGVPLGRGGGLLIGNDGDVYRDADGHAYGKGQG